MISWLILFYTYKKNSSWKNVKYKEKKYVIRFIDKQWKFVQTVQVPLKWQWRTTSPVKTWLIRSAIPLKKACSLLISSDDTNNRHQNYVTNQLNVSENHVLKSFPLFVIQYRITDQEKNRQCKKRYSFLIVREFSKNTQSFLLSSNRMLSDLF